MNAAIELGTTVADIIIDQLGGWKFLGMVNVKHYTATDNSLILCFTGSPKATHCTITLDADDTYHVTFNRTTIHRNGTHEFAQVFSERGVYCDQLQTIFSDVTGLATHL